MSEQWERVVAFVDELRTNGVHVGIGSPARCPVDGELWPCRHESPRMCVNCGNDEALEGRELCSECLEATDRSSSIELLQELLDSLPAVHPERPGVIRAIELLRAES